MSGYHRKTGLDPSAGKDEEMAAGRVQIILIKEKSLQRLIQAGR